MIETRTVRALGFDWKISDGRMFSERGAYKRRIAVLRPHDIEEWFDVDAEPLKFPDSVQPEEREAILSAWHRWSANNNDGCDPESDIALINSLMAAAGIEAK